jgi:hypothetical protein
VFWRAFGAIESAEGGFVNLVKDTFDRFALRWPDIRVCGATANFFVEQQFVIIEATRALFENFASTRKHLRSVHITGVCEIPGDSCHPFPGCANISGGCNDPF